MSQSSGPLTDGFSSCLDLGVCAAARVASRIGRDQDSENAASYDAILPCHFRSGYARGVAYPRQKGRARPSLAENCPFGPDSGRHRHSAPSGPG